MIRYNPEGLTSREVAESRERHGDNVITPPKDDSAWRLLAEKFRDPIIRILLLAAVLSLAIGFVHKDFTESIGIICAIILATCVGFWFEWDAQRRFRRLNRVNDDVAVKVMRDGAIREIPRREVVVGDVVYVESGETVPADGELVEAFLDVMERHKMVVENAGLLTVAALRHLDCKEKNVVSVLSGGNMDVITMASLVQHGLICRGRIFTFAVQLPDRPGELMRVAGVLSQNNGNIIKLEHNQFVNINRQSGVELRVTLEAFGHDHKAQILDALRQAGYQVSEVDTGDFYT